MEQIETKLNLENDILALKKEYKSMHNQVALIKSEYASIAELKKNVDAQISEAKEYLTSVNNEISESKLKWVTDKNVQMQELEKKQAEAQKIIDKRYELGEEEIKLQKIKNDTVEARNEKRMLEEKIKGEKKEIEVERKTIEVKYTELDTEKELFSKEKEGIKKQIVEMINKINEL